jgi:type I restriction-modification system DNA methylase subunit
MNQSTLSQNPYRNSNLFSGHYLKERVKELDEWEDAEGVEAAFDQLQELWEKEDNLVAGHKEDPLIDKWIEPVLEILGHETIPEQTLPDGGGYIDRLLYESEEVYREAAERKLKDDPRGTFSKASALLEAKQWNANFTKRFSEDRQYRDASHQVKFYLERTPENIQWGILTNGKKWRLYGTKDYETQTFYEIDLPELLESGTVEDFKYFYLFFRLEAFKSVAGDTFLDTVWNESETAAQELGEDLQDNVFTALRVLGKGFLETNDLNIDPDDDEALDELKEQSLVLLYRLMFILYAESRHLINPDEPEAQREYEENFSLDQKRVEIRDAIREGETFDSAYSEYSTSIWQRLRDLFRLIDQGKDDLGIPAYNGGLFDSDEHEFLTENGVADEYLAEVIYRISTTKTDDGEFVLADYADLDTRHLGSIYEGLLEHEFRIAPEQYAAVSEDGRQVWQPATEVSVADAVETVPESGLYVVNDDGERKSTGSYYTPDYVVTYIVEETIDPLIEEIKDELRADGLEPSDRQYFMRFWQSVQELKILDPAMGSGHFLTKATGYLTERVMEVVREQELQSYDEQEFRRKISKECIYGVDLNGMAVELAKLSMWLETLAADQPLAFLDHHLKAGNSLVGSDISEILSTEDDDTDDKPVQTTLSDWMEQTRREALEHVMDLMQDLLDIDNDELSDIKEMERTYEEIRSDPLFTHLLEMASVHTAAQFGLDVPDNADEKMAKALRDDSWADVAETDWFRSAQAMAREEQFFHWEMEFPEVFFGEDGEVAEDAGFDAVVGNPPYVPTEQIPTDQRDYLTYFFDTLHRKYDLSVAFLEKSFLLAKNDGLAGMITPVSWETGENYTKFRSKRLAKSDPALTQIINLPFDVFADAYVDTNIAIFDIDGGGIEEFKARELEKRSKITDADSIRKNFDEVPYHYLRDDDNSKIYFSEEDYKLIHSHDSEEYCKLGDITKARQGIVASFYNYSDEQESLNYLPYRECDVYRYSLSTTEEKYIDFSDEDTLREFYNQPRILLRRLVSRDDRLMAVYAEDTFVVKKDLNPFIRVGTDMSHRYLLACVNSSLLSYIYISSSALAQKDDFRQTTLSEIRSLPIRKLEPNGETDKKVSERLAECQANQSETVKPRIRKIVSEALETDTGQKSIHDFVVNLVKDIRKNTDRRNQLNLFLFDHFGISPEKSNFDGPTLPEIGFSQPPKNSADSILHETTETRDKLQIERAKVERENPNTVTIHLTVRYKPDNEDGHDLDQYGYTETEFLPALRITDLTETEADLVEAFVPVAVDEAGGFAGFRDNATKTNSLVDRLKQLTLPVVDDVADGLESYVETMERAEELEAKIERTDDLIDQIVYELYGLTDEEIEIVEEAVAE